PETPQRPPAVAERIELAHRGLVDLGTAPGDAAEKPGRDAPRSDQDIAAVFGWREHDVAAAGKPARRAREIAGPQRRAIASDDDRAAVPAQRPRQRAVHSLAEIGAALLRAVVQLDRP